MAAASRQRNLEPDVADRENPRAQAEYPVAEIQVARHVQPGETDVHPVEKRHDVQEKQKGSERVAILRTVACWALSGIAVFYQIMEGK